ncbi:MAG TPA: hypothetical protein EYP56_04215 [Planctomycetaceae bacterium]|nr:hypothetical protein [Planctomycetaceae bacterium]HIQ21332.1 hypothetical protein [Planctomycetota bacterium]
MAQWIYQRRLVAVEIAGARARIDACNSLLERLKEQGQATGGRAEQIETLKIGAEIELAGLTARRRALHGLIAEGKARAESIAARRKLERGIQSAEDSIRRVKRAIG